MSRMGGELMERHLYCINRDGVPEWVVAHSKEEALNFITSIWGMKTALEHFNEYFEDLPCGAEFTDSMKIFVDTFVEEEPAGKEFTRCDEVEVKVTTEEILADRIPAPFYVGSAE